jgi:predicted 3-demethylubiquinone-9 3-methyltransferase (glyoxalase superfamily)
MAGQVLTVSFELNRTAYLALNGGSRFTFNEAVSLMVHCDDQSEIDYYWDKLLDGGSAMACGWLKDKYGLAWQIVPARFFELIRSDKPERAARVIAAMNTMVKFDLAALEKAAEGD